MQSVYYIVVYAHSVCVLPHNHTPTANVFCKCKMLYNFLFVFTWNRNQKENDFFSLIPGREFGATILPFAFRTKRNNRKKLFCKRAETKYYIISTLWNAFARHVCASVCISIVLRFYTAAYRNQFPQFQNRLFVVSHFNFPKAITSFWGVSNKSCAQSGKANVVCAAAATCNCVCRAPMQCNGNGNWTTEIFNLRFSRPIARN